MPPFHSFITRIGSTLTLYKQDYNLRIGNRKVTHMYTLFTVVSSVPNVINVSILCGLRFEINVSDVVDGYREKYKRIIIVAGGQPFRDVAPRRYALKANACKYV